MTPFELFDQDTDEVIMVINYYIEKGNGESTKSQNGDFERDKRIRVNDKTATGGWY